MTSKDGQGAYVQRGMDLFELTCTADDCTWTTMPTKFSTILRWGVAMHLTGLDYAHNCLIQKEDPNGALFFFSLFKAFCELRSTLKKAKYKQICR